MNMHLPAIQMAVMDTAAYKTQDYPFLAIGEETGEVQGKLAKFVRKNGVSASEALMAIHTDPSVKYDELRETLSSELFDVFWNYVACCDELGISIEQNIKAGLAKLQDRKARNVIIGEGDLR